ncbi:F-box protein SKIP16 [Typha latifolia]|uniref:F-box protein SKIP16 n=1 Tax=Typha latifolia TaxID=4733 RepID=UPI003C2CAD3E
MAMGLEGLEDLILETIVSNLGPKHAAMLACVSTRLKGAAVAENLWRRFCAEDFDLCDRLDPDGNPCPSFKETYKIWFESFGMYPLPFVKRAKNCWNSLRNWMAENFPEVNDTLKKGVSETQIKSAEEALGFKLPMPTKVLYRFCNGQQTVSDNPSESRRLAPLGIIGGYEFYNHLVNVHILSLEQIVPETIEVAKEVGFPEGSKFILVAASLYVEKFFFLNCANGQLYVGTKNLMSDGEMMPCVPQALIRPTVDANHDMPQDALLLWLEEHCRRLQSGMIRTRVSRKSRSICLYPEEPPSCSLAITNGVQVRASSVLVPEASDLTGPEKYFYSYSIRMSLLPEGCILDGMYFSSCQLYSRHWIIRSRDTVVSDVQGEAVIGKFPLLFPNEGEFVYESCTPLPEAPGSVEGSFTFVPGRLSKREGRQFDVKVAPFVLVAPEYIF